MVDPNSATVGSLQGPGATLGGLCTAEAQESRHGLGEGREPVETPPPPFRDLCFVFVFFPFFHYLFWAGGEGREIRDLVPAFKKHIIMIIIIIIINYYCFTLFSLFFFPGGGHVQNYGEMFRTMGNAPQFPPKS